MDFVGTNLCQAASEFVPKHGSSKSVKDTRQTRPKVCLARAEGKIWKEFEEQIHNAFL